MESKKINQLATELAPDLSDITIIGDPTTGVSKKITLSQMASLFTGTVEEYANFAAFPLVGVADTIYVAKDTNVIYRWDSTAYVVLSPNVIASLVFNDANGFDGTISLVGSVATLTITTALTTGSVPFIGASGALLEDNTNFFWNNTNKRLGIGTNTPGTKLDVHGTGTIVQINGTTTNNAFISFQNAGVNKWTIGNVQADHRFRIYSEANSTELVSVLQTGEFGIGISNPTTKVHIDGAASALIVNLDADTSIAKSISFRTNNTARWNTEVSGTESGTNAGMDYFVRSYSDAGSLIETPLSIVRSTGVTTIKSLTLTNALAATSGGTGQSSYAIGDILYASTTTALSKLADIATGNALISGGVGVAPSWGKIALTTHVSGILPIANGGTGSATQNFVDLTTTQSIGGAKTLTSALAGTSASFSSTSTATAFIPSGATVPTNGMYLSAANTLNFATDTTNRITISSLGSVGINGTPTVFSNNVYFDVIGNNTSQGGIIQTKTSNASILGSFFADTNGLNIRTETAHNIIFTLGGTERMRILQSNGNIGIGTNSPNYSGYTSGITVLSLATSTSDRYSALELVGNRAAGGNQNGDISFINNNGTATVTSRIQAINTTTSALGGELTFLTKADAGSLTEKMRLTTAGGLCLGYTTDAGYQLRMSGYAYVGGNLVCAGDGSISSNLGIGRSNESGVRLSISAAGTSSSAYSIITRDSSGNDLFVLRNDGLVLFGTNARASSPYTYNVTYNPRTAGLGQGGDFGYITSTRESKGNIETIKNIDFINQLNPVSFNYRKKDTHNKEFINELYEDIYYGFIADELEIIDKNLVFYDDLKDGSKKLSGVHYNSMIALLTKAVQELKAEVEILKAK